MLKIKSDTNQHNEHCNIMSTSTRQIVLDIETTGMNRSGKHYEGHRIIEIGAVEIVNRRLTGRHYHAYIQPDRLIESEAYRIHGISDEFLTDKPIFDHIADEFLDFIRGEELIIHNAAFDIGFIDNEFHLSRQRVPKIRTFCAIIDSLLIARQLFPHKRNNLDALCSRYKIDNSKRSSHGALLDAKILASVYLAMTSGQVSMLFQSDTQKIGHENNIQHIPGSPRSIKVIYANDEEKEAHETYLDSIKKKNNMCLWRASVVK